MSEMRKHCSADSQNNKKGGEVMGLNSRRQACLAIAVMAFNFICVIVSAVSYDWFITLLNAVCIIWVGYAFREELASLWYSTKKKEGLDEI